MMMMMDSTCSDSFFLEFGRARRFEFDVLDKVGHLSFEFIELRNLWWCFL